jgi:manganese-transporting P-type ATPase
LSKERPQTNIFNIYLIGSVLGQFAIHVGTLIYISQYVAQFEEYSFLSAIADLNRPDAKVDLEAEFKPSLLNSAIYLVQLIQQVSTFAINYQGRPFRESLRENRTMFWSIVGVTGIAFACSIEFIPELNEKLRLVKFTPEFQQVLTLTMIVDYAGCWIVEQGFKFAFSDNKPKEIATRNRLGEDKKSV